MGKALLALAILCAGGFFLWRAVASGTDPTRPDVLLVVIDTCRADRVGFNGYRLTDGSSPTPELDRLAAASTPLRDALSPVPLTLPAVTSILSGRYPDGHGVRENDTFRIPGPGERAFSLLQEDLRRLGYRTAAVVSGQPLDRRFGLAQGFESYDQPAREMRPRHHMQFRERAAEETSERALAFLRSDDPRPFFLLLHYFDPHMPYEDSGLLSAATPRPGDRAYVSEIARVDRAIGRVLRALPEGGENMLIIVTGDHGESLGDHGEATHGYLAYESTLRVPFLMKLPRGREAPAREGLPARLVDIRPTILEVVGAGGEERRESDGSSLLQPPPLRWNHRAETLYGWYQHRYARVRTYRDRKFKLIEDGPRLRLFDWRADPEERHDLWAERETEGRRLLDELLTSLQNRPPGRAAFVHVAPSAATPYMGVRSETTPLEPGEEENSRLHPVESGLALIRALEVARGHIRAGDPGRAALLLERFADQREGNPALLFWTARSHLLCADVEGLSDEERLRRLDRALELFQEHERRFGSTRSRDSALRVRLRRSCVFERMAREAGDPDSRSKLKARAVEDLLAIVKSVSAAGSSGRTTVIALATAGQALEQLGRIEEALASFREALRRDPEDVRLRRDVKRLSLRVERKR